MKTKVLIFVILVLMIGSCSRAGQEDDNPIDNAEDTELAEYDYLADCYERTADFENDPIHFYQKYQISFEWYEEGGIGKLITFYEPCYDDEEAYLRPKIGRASESTPFDITECSDGRLIIHPLSHNGWPGSIAENSDAIDDNVKIEVFISSSNDVTLRSNIGVLSQIPEVQAHGFYVDRVIGIRPEHLTIRYHEREVSTLWQWLMNPYNAWQLHVHEPTPTILIDVPVWEITNNLWELWGIQAFEYGGDVTFISRRGVLSQIPEFNEDEYYFNLETTDKFELLYIMHHEREDSSLWQLFMEEIGAVPEEN
jgi:hypothetical protein